MGRLDFIYAKLPVWAQHAAATGYGAYRHWLRFGPGFQEKVAEYKQRERFGHGEWAAWQEARLKQFLSGVVDTVPYYRETWNQDAKMAACAGRLSELPLLEKEPLRMSPQAFLREDLRISRPMIYHTSGSTGTPIATYWTTAEARESKALREARSAHWAGVSFRRPRATFSGRIVEPDPMSRGPFYRYNAFDRQVYLSAFHLRPDTAAAYARALRRHRVEWLTGYAVSYYLLAQFILEQGLELPPLQALVTTSEKVTSEMRSVMEKAYQCRVFEEYSTVENAVFASECEHRRLHVSPDAGVFEILRPDRTPCNAGEVGEVVATCLVREYQPLIRYRLGDLAVWDGNPCSCGRAMPVLKEVIGRLEDVIVGPDGRKMVRFHGIFVNQPHVREGQVIQETLNKIRVRIVPAAGYCEADSQEVIHRVQVRLGSGVSVTVECVDAIARTRAGKFKAVVSCLNLTDTGGGITPDPDSACLDS